MLSLLVIRLQLLYISPLFDRTLFSLSSFKGLSVPSVFPVKVSSGQDDGSAVKRETRLPQKRRYQTYQTNLNPVPKKKP